MHRKYILDLLSSYIPSREEELGTLSRFCTFVSENSHCFARDLKQGHVTGSAWIIDKTRSYALFTHHRKLNKWLQLGGHADGDCDIFAVALKEAKEESGLQNITALSREIFDIDIHLVQDRTHGEHYHYDVRFLFEADRTEQLVISHESKELKWMPLDEIVHLTTEPSVLRMLNKTKQLFTQKSK